MSDNRLNTSQATALLCVFLCGSSGITNGMRSGGFAPLALLCAAGGAVFPALLFIRTFGKNHSRNLFDTAKSGLPCAVYKLFSALLILCAASYACVSLNTFTRFINATTLPETPPLVIAVAVCAVAALTVKSGLNTAGKCSQVFLTFIIITTVITSLFTLSTGKIASFSDNFRLDDFTRDGIFIFCGSFCKTTVFLGAVSHIKTTRKPSRIIWRATAGAVLIMGATMLRDLATVGSKVCAAIDYPSYYALSAVNLFDFIQRIEVISTINALFFSIVDVIVCVFCVCAGLSRLIKVPSGKDFAFPVGFVIAGVSAVINGVDDYWFYIIFAATSVLLCAVVAVFSGKPRTLRL